MSSVVNTLYSRIEEGRRGHNKGLSTGLNKLDSITYGVIRDNITLVGGSSGSGKTSVTIFMSVYLVYLDYLKSNKELDPYWLIFSFEMSEDALFARILSMHLWDEYKIQISYADLLSLNYPMNDDIFKYVQESEAWLEELASRCIIIDSPVTAKGLYAQCKSFTELHGKYEEEIVIKNGKELVKTTYIPNNPEQYLIILVDHVKLFSVQSGHTSKQEIDEACVYLIQFRKKCKCSIFIVQLLNRGFLDMSRRTEAGGAYQDIQLNDFSDTGDTVNASNTVLAVFFPFREKLSKWKDYIVDPKRGGLGDLLRTISVLKNRDGNADKYVGVHFHGNIHQWLELPKPTEITDYSKFINLE